MIVTIISKERGLVTIITFRRRPGPPVARLAVRTRRWPGSPSAPAGGRARRPHPPVAGLAARTRQCRPPWDDEGLTLDEEGSWIPRPLVPCPVPARCAPRAAPT